MKIKHLHKTTLIDYPGKIACTLFLYGCNFRCAFCHNPELVVREEGEDWQEEEVFDFLNKRKQYLDGICITGGEPLLTLEESFLRRLKELGYLVKLDTNGSFPDKLEEFINKGLIDFISMDIKSCKEQYGQAAGVDVDVEKIGKSMELIINSGLDYEFRTTILESMHSKQAIENMVRWIAGLGGRKLVLQGFKNAGKTIGNLQEADARESYLQELAEIARQYIENVEVRV